MVEYLLPACSTAKSSTAGWLPAPTTKRYVTDLIHMPRNHQEWRKAEGFDAEYFLKNAAKIDPAAKWAMARVLASR